MNENRLVTLEEHFLDVAAIQSNEIIRQQTEWLPAKIKNPLLDLGEGRLRAMDENGITTQVLSASPPMNWNVPSPISASAVP